MPVVWMRLVRDAAPKFGSARMTVLWALGIRMDRNGSGFASHDTLAGDAGVSATTAWRATSDARRRGYLVQTRRGHRVTDVTTIASAWQLTQPITGDELAEIQLLTGDELDPTQLVTGATQLVTRDELRAPLTRAPAASSATRIVLEHTNATDEEAVAVVELVRREKHPRALAPFLRRLADDGELPDWLDRLRAERGHRDRDDAMRAGWLCSRCRNRNRVDAQTCRQCGEGRAA